MNMLAVEVWMLVDEDGQYVVGEDKGTCAERFAENYEFGEQSTRWVRVTINVPAPKPAECMVTIKPEVETAEGVEVEASQG